MTNEPSNNSMIVRHMATRRDAIARHNKAKGAVTIAENRLKNMGFSIAEIKEAEDIVEAGTAHEWLKKQNRIIQIMQAHGVSFDPKQLDMLDDAVLAMPQIEKAFLDGQIAALRGEPRANPYQSGEAVQKWEEGYDAGVDEASAVDEIPDPEPAKRGRPAKNRDDEIAADAEAQGVDLSPGDDEVEDDFGEDDDYGYDDDEDEEDDTVVDLNSAQNTEAAE